MPSKLANWVVKVAGAIVLLLVLCLVQIWGESFVARWRAAKFISLVQTIKPGKTTETEARGQLHGLPSLDESPQRSDTKAHEVSYFFDNGSTVAGLVSRIIPESWFPALDRLPLPHLTMLSGELIYRNGVVSKIAVHEAHWSSLQGGQASAAVKLVDLSSEAAKDCEYVDKQGVRSKGLPIDFEGSLTNTAYPFDRTSRQFITLDERASSAERSSAYNFRTRCMASMTACDTASALRPVVSKSKTLDLTDILICN